MTKTIGPAFEVPPLCTEEHVDRAFKRAGFETLWLNHSPSSGARTADGWGYEICRSMDDHSFTQEARGFKSPREAAEWFSRHQEEFDPSTGKRL